MALILYIMIIHDHDLQKCIFCVAFVALYFYLRLRNRRHRAALQTSYQNHAARSAPYQGDLNEIDTDAQSSASDDKWEFGEYAIDPIIRPDMDNSEKAEDITDMRKSNSPYINEKDTSHLVQMK